MNPCVTSSSHQKNSCDACSATRYTGIRDQVACHPGPEKFVKTSSKAGIQPAHARKLRLQLTTLYLARKASDMASPGWRLHALHGDLREHFSVSVSGNWRLIFTFEQEDAVLVNYLDYH